MKTMKNIAWLALVVLLCACANGLQVNPERSAILARDAAASNTVPDRVGVAAAGSKPRAPKVDDEDIVVSAAATNPARLDNDRIVDARRKGDEVMKFLQIRPGMTVLDLYSGGGYYSELVSFIVGAKGAVVAHNNKPYLDFAKKELEQRYTPGRLSNVQRMMAENNELQLTPARFDAVLMVDTYHDIYYADEERGWKKIDGQKLMAEVFKSLKPGGVLGVIDHVAAAGAPPETGGTLHRIDPEFMKKDIVAAGFAFEAQSDILRNPRDDHTKPIFDASIRGRTDQVVMKFRKPR
jgi:predicted methyltransferase